MFYGHLPVDAKLLAYPKKPVFFIIAYPLAYILHWLFAKSIETTKEKYILSQEVDLAALKAHDEEKFFEYLFRTYYAPLCKSVHNVVRDTDASEDIVQDVFIKVWRRRAELDISRSIQSYLFRSCMNTALNYLEKNKKNTSIENENVHSAAFSSHHTEEGLAFEEVNHRVQEALDTLPPKCKMVFSMSRYEEMSYADIASTLNISVKAVEKHMSKALKIMREYLKAYLGYSKSV